jgi:superfamily I DNA/RNA helicase/RecB family exonuclease
MKPVSAGDASFAIVLNPGPEIDLDASQRAVVGLGDDRSAVVIGAPGSGKTVTLIETVADRILNRGWDPSELVVLTTTRATATGLRDRLALRIGRATNGPLARSVGSIAFEIVGASVKAVGSTKQGGESPRLLTGGEQDSIIAQLLDGEVEDGNAAHWPELLTPAVRGLRGFRTELRELMMRATEYGITSELLRELGQQHGHDEWVAAADFIDGYLDVVSALGERQFDSAELIQFATAALARNEVPESVSRLRLVLVDDLHDATSSTVSLLRALARRGVAIVGFGDPDVAANAFRGGEPDVIGRFAEVLQLPELTTMHLGAVHRQGTSLRALTQSIVERIGTAGAVGHRGAIAVGQDHPDAIIRIDAKTPAREWAAIASQFREHHLLGGIPWSSMAVVVRSSAHVPIVARALALADVPTASTSGGQALRDDPAARALLRVVEVATRRVPLTADTAAELLLGPFGGLDRIGLRRLRLALRTEELAGEGNRTADELLVEALESPGRFATIDHRTARAAGRLAETLHSAGQLANGDGTIEELLWLIWERSSLAKAWFDAALGSGVIAAEANRNLDGVVALFTAAKRFVEREPDSPPGNFLEAVLDAEVPEDTLSPRSAGESVLVTTPSGVVGSEFDVVAVAGLQDGTWPNLRLRGSLLHPQELVRIVTGLAGVRLDERREVLGDELRLFALAVSRARRQVILAAVTNDDEAASVFLALTPSGTRIIDPSTRSPLTLRGLTGRLRRDLVTASPSPGRVEAASALSLLAAEGVPGADPRSWHGLIPVSTEIPLYEGDEFVPVSPSKMESFETSPLDWFVDTVSGSQTSSAMGIGTIVHWAMETANDPSIDTVWRAIEERWSELVFESPWIGEQYKRTTRRLAEGVAEYLADFERDGKTLVSAEPTFVLEVDRARVSGKIDRVERSADGSVVIVDLKTGTPMTRADDIAVNAQLSAYQLAYAEGKLDDFLEEFGGHKPGGAKLLYVKRGLRNKLYREGVQAPLEEEGLEAFRTRIRQAAIGMAAISYLGPKDLDRYSGFGPARRMLQRVRAVSSD